MDNHSRNDGLLGSPSVRDRAGLRWWVIAVCSIALGLIAGVLIARSANPYELHASSSKVFTSNSGTFTPEHGQVAPAWLLPDLRHPQATISLSQFHRPLVLNFWASWCAPCREEMPALERVAKSLGGKVDFVGLDTQDDQTAGLSFARSTGVTYPLADDNVQIWSAYGVYGLPVTYFIAPNGSILGKQVGGLTEARLRSLIQKEFGISTVPGK